MIKTPNPLKVIVLMCLAMLSSHPQSMILLSFPLTSNSTRMSSHYDLTQRETGLDSGMFISVVSGLSSQDLEAIKENTETSVDLMRKPREHEKNIGFFHGCVVSGSILGASGAFIGTMIFPAGGTFWGALAGAVNGCLFGGIEGQKTSRMKGVRPIGAFTSIEESARTTADNEIDLFQLTFHTLDKATGKQECLVFMKGEISIEEKQKKEDECRSYISPFIHHP